MNLRILSHRRYAAVLKLSRTDKTADDSVATRETMGDGLTMPGDDE